MPALFIRIDYTGDPDLARAGVGHALDYGELQDHISSAHRDVDVTDATLLSSDLTELALSMQHHHRPEVRSYGDELMRRLGGKP